MVFTKDENEPNHFFILLKEIGFSVEEIVFIFKLLAILLHLSNISHEDNGKKKLFDNWHLNSTEIVSNLMEIDQDIISDIITCKENRKIDSMTQRHQASSNEIVACKDGISKIIYERLLDFVTKKVNLKCNNGDSPRFAYHIIDCPGYMALSTNRFEELCSNYVYEKIQWTVLKVILENVIVIYL
jgi:myosin heavy subunit